MTHYLKIETEIEILDDFLWYCVYKHCDFTNSENELARFKYIEDAERYARVKAFEWGIEYKEKPKKRKKKKEKKK